MISTDTALPSIDTLKKSYTYKEYRDLIEELLEVQKTTGENHSEVRLHHSTMNHFRMDRLDKYAELNPDLEEKLKNLQRKYIWLVITEGWSGDAAQNLPIINKMAEVTPNIELRLYLRDENLELMDQFLTDGKSRSIPKLICIDANFREVIGTWGPRPETAQEIAKDLKNVSESSSREGAERLHKWYADDKNQEIQEEFLMLIDQWESQ